MSKVNSSNKGYYSFLTQHVKIYSYIRNISFPFTFFNCDSKSLIDDIKRETNYRNNIILDIGTIDENVFVYLLFLNNLVFLFDQSDFRQNILFFIQIRDIILFFDEKIKIKFHQLISKTYSQSYLKTKNSIDFNAHKQNLLEIVKKSIIMYIHRENNKLEVNSDIKKQFENNDFIDFQKITNKVYLKFNINYKSLYILKIFHNNQERLKRNELTFYKEISNTCSYIPKYYGDFANNDKTHIVIEYINGITLDKFIKKNGNLLKPIEKIKIICQIIFAIECIHYHQLILRDLKCSNILIDKDLKIYLIDFDNSKKINEMESCDCDNYISSEDIGSILYFSPEQYCENKYSYKSDIYTIGKIIHYILTGLVNPINENLQNNLPDEFAFLKDSYQNCFEILPNKRPTIAELYIQFIEAVLNKYEEGSFENELIENIIEEHKKEIQSFFGITFKDDSDSNYDQFDLADIKKSLSNLKIASKHNNPDAQYILGLIYYQGKYVDKSIDESIYYFKLASKKEHIEAIYMLGKIYSKNTSSMQNINKSIKYLKIASSEGYSKALYRLGKLYYNQTPKNAQDAIIFLTMASKKNNIKACFLLGEIYLRDFCLWNDIEKSIEYLSLAAEKENSTAQYYLGLIFYEIKYGKRDAQKAIDYLQKSASCGNLNAQFLLGLIYYENEIIQRDINESIKYFELSSNQNHKESQYYLGIIYLEGKYVERNIDKSIKYLQLASESHHSYAQIVLGFIYINEDYKYFDILKSICYLELVSNQRNEYVCLLKGFIYFKSKEKPRDIEKSIEYLSLAAEKGNSTAQYYLGLIFYEIKYGKRDAQKAIDYLQKSARFSNPNAQFLLGLIYYENEIIQRDINKSIKYLKLSSNQNHKESQYYLGIIYLEGKYVERNIDKSIKYLQLASESHHLFALVIMGLFYHEGKYLKQNIDKAINCYKNFMNKNGKYYVRNNLGSIYTKRDKVKASEYFQEAINLQNDLYSYYNLAKLFYFDLRNEQNIIKSIKLLENASKNIFLLAYIFLFYIYFCGEVEEKRDKNKAEFICRQIQNISQIDEISSIIISIYYKKDDLLCKRLQIFIKDYDLIYFLGSSPIKDFIYFMKNQKFEKQTTKSEEINSNFYNGFEC